MPVESNITVYIHCYINIGRENKFSMIQRRNSKRTFYNPTFMCHYNGDKTFIKSIYSKLFLKIIENQVYGNKLSGTTDIRNTHYFK